MKHLLFLFLFITQMAFAGKKDPVLLLSPIPLTSSVLKVDILQPTLSIASIELRNLIGRELQNKKRMGGTDFIEFQDMDTYPNGLYVIIAKDAQGKIIETTKFIINK
jgi:CRISPR/Cas system CMR-associated protein Cmr3 (group 5 of RAMP superfamily)